MARPISLAESIAPLATMLVCFIVGGRLFSAAGGLLVAVMLIAAAVAGVIAWRHGHGWEEMQRSAGDKLGAVLPAILILLSIGMLIGTWMFSGTIPLLVYYGLQWISPTYFVFTAFLVTAVMSLTGSSWASAGTIGVALMGIAAVQGAPLAATAGAVVSGAYFGDKLSPLSDSTNICAIGAGANLYDHIRNLLYTSLPSFVVAAVVYAVVGVIDAQPQRIIGADGSRLIQEIPAHFRVSGFVFLPALVVVAGTLKRYHAALTMAASCVVAVVVGVVLHGFSLADGLTAAVSGFRAEMTHAATAGVAPSSMLAGLLNRGGLYSMSDTLVLIIAAFLLAAAMDVAGALQRLLRFLLSGARSVFRLVAMTMVAGATVIALTSHNGVTALIVGGLFQDAYRERGLAPENLSRTMEDSATIIEPIMPWTVSAIFMATTLGVPTIEYMPWAVFCSTGAIFSLLLAAAFSRTGFGLRPLAASGSVALEKRELNAPRVHGAGR